MSKLNPKSFSLNVAKEIEKLILHIKDVLIANSDIIESSETEGILYAYDKNYPDFVFIIEYPKIESRGNNADFKVSLLPTNSASKVLSTYVMDLSNTMLKFDKWISIIRDFNSISFNDDDEFLKQYEDEIFAEFENVDEDADVMPYDIDRQVILHKFLEATTKCLEQRHPDVTAVEEIIAEANSLKNDVAKISKKIASKRLSKVLAKIRKYNPVTFRDIYDVAKKEVIKHLLHKGVENLPKLIEAIQAIH